MSTAFPASYDELAVLAHYGASERELTRRLAEREQMTLMERFHVDVQARAHVGPTIADHRARWGSDRGTREPETAPPVELEGDGDEPSDEPVGDVPDGTMADVLGWVGADPSRARAAITAEKARTDPRSSLLARLERIAGG
jgi:hypothetical protein